MLLRASSQNRGAEVDVRAVMGDAADSGVAHGELLVAFAEAVVGSDTDALPSLRERLVEAVGPDGFVDAVAVVANFQRMVRIADSMGIPLDAPMEGMTRGLREEIGVAAFGSAANTPAVTPEEPARSTSAS
ncbi:MAG: hypothetical protein V3V67_10780 [Myxococcota bacterium]